MKTLIEFVKENCINVHVYEGEYAQYPTEITLTEAQLLAAHDAHCKQLEPVLTNTNYGVTMQDRNFSASGDAIYDNNFDYDARLTVSGDFADGIKEEYAKMIASVLNDHKKPIPSEVKAYIERLDYALQLLRDNQNGCPLPSYEEDWNEAMRLSLIALASKPDCLKD